MEAFMDLEKIVELQYLTLRKEIEITKDRIFKIITGGATVVPLAQFLAISYNLGIVTMLLPFLVVIMTLLFLSEMNALMRCGRYIRTEIEPLFKAKKITGWESWLESNMDIDTRKVDRYVGYSFYILTFFYYVLSVFLAVGYANQVYDSVGLAISLGLYIAISVWVLSVILQGVTYSTTTRRTLGS
jgi:hypothetical protein